jgi:hypothetical protein
MKVLLATVRIHGEIRMLEILEEKGVKTLTI